jgi:hypothetical protein
MKRVYNVVVRACSWLAGHAGALIAAPVVVLITSAASPVWGHFTPCTGGYCYTGGHVGIGTTSPGNKNIWAADERR